VHQEIVELASSHSVDQSTLHEAPAQILHIAHSHGIVKTAGYEVPKPANTERKILSRVSEQARNII